ncbi:HAD-IIB family hydrolase [Paenibacillus sp. IITD108]|uniref:HAD-IIB family hydrolase n=1 Tax=Paenibacillus sp. IITD108 TaxID=3116649 RepID=UPI002F40F40C
MKTIVFDIDGTICFNGQTIPEPIIQALDHVISKGADVIFASARPIRDLLPVLPQHLHHHSLIGGNGSLIQQEGKITHAVSFDPAAANQLSELLDQYQAHYLADSPWDYAYRGPDNHPILERVDPNKLAKRVMREQLSSLVKLLILHADDMDGLEQELSGLPIVIHRHRHEQALDISPPGIHKWSALQKLGVSPGQFIAFGNDANDVTMFQHAGEAVMIGEHEMLIDLATSAIPIDDDYIERISKKITMLG